MRLFHKVLLLSLCLALLPLLSAGPWIAFHAASALREEALARQRSVAERTAGIVAVYLDDLRAVLDVVQRAPGLLEGGAEERRLALKGVLDNYPQFEELRILDGSGHTGAVMSRFRESADGVRAGWADVEKSLASKGYHMGPVREEAGVPYMDVVVPFSGGASRRLAARVNLLDMSGRLKGMDMADGGSLYVLDARGSTAARWAAGDAGPAPDPGAREAALRGGTFPGPGGAPFLAAAVPVADSGWQVLFEQSAAAALGVVERERRRFILSIGAAALLAVFLSYLLGRRLAGPLEEMRGALVAMEKGRFDVNVREHSRDEIGSAAEALRRAQSALERRVRQATVGLLAQRIGHDMRQNLGAIRMRAETLRRRLPAGDPEAEKGFAAIAREVERGADYIEELLTFGRERPPNLLPRDVNALVREVLGRVPGRPEVKVSLALADGLPACPLDQGEVGRALTNIINNAHESLSGPGEVRVSTRRAEGRLEVSVADTGCGIPADKKDRLFEDFFSTKPTGTGLGMGIVKRVMDRHGGSVRLSSEPGKGTTVVLSFPAGAAA